MTASTLKVLQPPDWARPRGYANGVMARGQTVFVAGMIGWDAQCQFQTDDFAGQVGQALQNVVAVLNEAGLLALLAAAPVVEPSVETSASTPG